MKGSKQHQAQHGSTHEGLPKPMDRPFPDYENSETVPAADFCEEPLAEDFENPGDLSKRFS